MTFPIVSYLLKVFLKKSQKLVLERHGRYLSFGDYVSDRWGKAKRLGFGEGTSVYDNVLILGNVKVGCHTWIGPNCILDGSGGELVIGDYCSISAGVHIYTHNSVDWSLSEGDSAKAKKSTIIGDYCYIGPNSIIAMGTKIENKCIVGALSFVNGIHVHAGAKVFGIPAKIINY